mmetsp:Transcript_59481/g.166111  ORF Transcript_59481/g.166111 Transcript_59481/m.166111 type:complete len:367 (-) Transcript_59481:148-1248(-)
MPSLALPPSAAAAVAAAAAASPGGRGGFLNVGFAGPAAFSRATSPVLVAAPWPGGGPSASAAAAAVASRRRRSSSRKAVAADRFSSADGRLTSANECNVQLDRALSSSVALSPRNRGPNVAPEACGAACVVPASSPKAAETATAAASTIVEAGAAAGVPGGMLRASSSPFANLRRLEAGPPDFLACDFSCLREPFASAISSSSSSSASSLSSESTPMPASSSSKPEVSNNFRLTAAVISTSPLGSCAALAAPLSPPGTTGAQVASVTSFTSSGGAADGAEPRPSSVAASASMRRPNCVEPPRPVATSNGCGAWPSVFGASADRLAGQPVEELPHALCFCGTRTSSGMESCDASDSSPAVVSVPTRA